MILPLFAHPFVIIINPMLFFLNHFIYDTLIINLKTKRTLHKYYTNIEIVTSDYFKNEMQFCVLHLKVWNYIWPCSKICGYKDNWCLLTNVFGILKTMSIRTKHTFFFNAWWNTFKAFHLPLMSTFGLIMRAFVHA